MNILSKYKILPIFLIPALILFGCSPTVRQPSASPPTPLVSQSLIGTLRIWTAWEGSSFSFLEEAVKSFQVLYPEVTVDIQLIPVEELEERYLMSAFQGTGPDILLGPNSLSAPLAAADSATGLDDLLPSEVVDGIMPSARLTGEVGGKVVGLPVHLSGSAVFRNTALVPKQIETVDDLEGTTNPIFDLGFFFSGGFLPSQGGQWMDVEGLPAFNDSAGIEWLELLNYIHHRGTITINGGDDLEDFLGGEAGLIFDGSWILPQARSVLGDQLEIDPFPSYNGIPLSGFIQAESAFINPSTMAEQQALASSFLAHLVSPQVQAQLPKYGLVPSLSSVEITDPYIQKLHDIFTAGVPYPTLPVSGIYNEAISIAVSNSLLEGMTLEQVLDEAESMITSRIQNP